MIFFVDNNGKIINSQPETVYQGAADTNNIYLIAPFAANLSFAVAFKLPNGVYTERYMMTQGGQLEDIEYSPTQNIFALWKMSVPSNITQYFGTVKAQFYAYATDGAITATSATSFVVSQGVPEELPATPSQDIYNQILTALSQIQSQLNNGTFAARAIYWWIDTFTYGMNEITFYPIGEYGALVRSVVANNTGHAPYNDEGNLNSEYWQELVDFNKALNAIEEAAQSAAEAAQSATESAQSAAQSAASASAAAASEQNAAQSAQNAATSESNAAQSAEDAEQSAQDAAQSAQQAESSATDAAQSAVDAAESAQDVIDYLGKTTVFVTELPEVGDPSLLYFVTGDSDNLFSIYTYEDGEWKLMGESNLVINDTNTYLSALSASSWQSNRQTVSLTGLTPDDSVIVTPGNGYADEYIQYGISPVEIINGGIIFSCTSLPPVSIALVIEVTKEQTIPTATGYYTKPQTDSLINAEKTAREAADTNLQNNITAEATARQQADESLQSAITAEASARQSADSTLQQNITAEAQARTAADTALGDRIDDLVDGTTAAGKAVADGNGNNIVDTYATQSIVNNGLAQKQDITDNSLDTTSKTVVGAINENKAAIDGLRNDMVATDHFKGFAATAADVQKISGDLNDYVYCIATGTIWTYGANGWSDSGQAYPSDATPLGTTTPLMDGTGSAGSSSSAARSDHVHPTDTSRASASALQSEVSARQQADQTLQSSISAEASARQSADQTLQTNITNEATARANADTALGNRIDELVNGTTAVKNATNAVSAQSAATATNATNAENAVNATNAQAAATAQTAATATTAEKVAHKLTIITGDTTVEFDGSSDQSVQIEIDDSNDPNAVHFTQQTLTAEQQAQARTNISSASESALTAETTAREAADNALREQIDNIGSSTIVKTAAEWAANNTVLEAGQFGYDSTNKITKIGDGTTAWKTLPTLLSTDFSFEKASWSDIAALSESGSADKYFSVGNEKTISLTTGEQVTLVILGFNHDDLTGGGKAGMSIGMKNLLATTYRMNATETNAGGWDESEMRTSTMATLLSQLPSDLQSVIKQVNKKATAGGKSNSITTSADKLWLLAEVEVDGTTSAGYADEGERYEYWKTVKDGTVGADRIKYLSNGSGSEYGWWLRSPFVSSSEHFRNFTATGRIYDNSANYTRGVSFGFCV